MQGQLKACLLPQLLKMKLTRTVVQDILGAQAALCKAPACNVHKAGPLLAALHHRLQLQGRRLDVPQVALQQGPSNSPTAEPIGCWSIAL